MSVPRARTSPRPPRGADLADVGRAHRTRRSRPAARMILTAVALLSVATAVGCGRLTTAPTGSSATPNPAVAGSVVASAASSRAPAPEPAAAIAYDREGNAVAVQNFGDGRVPSAGDGPIWTCRYFAIAPASGSTFGIGPDLDGGPVTPTPGQPVWLSCPSGHDEYLAFDPDRPFGTWAP